LKVILKERSGKTEGECSASKREVDHRTPLPAGKRHGKLAREEKAGRKEELFRDRRIRQGTVIGERNLS